MPIPSFSNLQSTHNLGADWATGASDKEGEAVGGVFLSAKANSCRSIYKSLLDQGSDQNKHGKRVQDQVIQKSLLMTNKIPSAQPHSLAALVIP